MSELWTRCSILGHTTLADAVAWLFELIVQALLMYILHTYNNFPVLPLVGYFVRDPHLTEQLRYERTDPGVSAVRRTTDCGRWAVKNKLFYLDQVFVP